MNCVKIKGKGEGEVKDYRRPKEGEWGRRRGGGRGQDRNRERNPSDKNFPNYEVKCTSPSDRDMVCFIC